MTSGRRVVVNTVVNDPFRFGLVVTARTLFEKNPDLDIRYRVLYHDELSPLSPTHRAWLATHIPKVEFVHVDIGPFANVFRLRDEVFRTPRRLWAAFLILDAFREVEEDAIVLCLDCDMICTAPLGPEIFLESGFAAVEARTPDGQGLGFFNTGVMAIGRDHRGPEPFERIMAISDTSRYVSSSGKADQAVLSLIYRPDNAVCLPSKYNVTRRQVGASAKREIAAREAVFFHYVGSKPWSISLDDRDGEAREALELWDDSITRLLRPEEELEYLRFFRAQARRAAKAHVDARTELPPSERVALRVVRAARRAVRPFLFWRRLRATAGGSES